MSKNAVDQRTIFNVGVDDYLITWLEQFIIDRKAKGLSRRTIDFYTEKLRLLVSFLDSQAITQISQVTPSTIRQYILHLEQTGHNQGGVHAAYRAFRAFIYWWEFETEPDDWKNPFKKVKAPHVPTEPLEGVNNDIVTALLTSCQTTKFTDIRDRAIVLSLLDTGARAQEFISMDLSDFNQVSGEILIRQGKGRKPRYVYLGKQSRKAVRRYLKTRNGISPALWVTDEGERLSYSGLRQIIRRRAVAAGIKTPALHDFRRGFCLAMLRAGTDIFTLQKLMGHADIQILRRYLAQTDEDTRAAHVKSSPVDRM